MNAENTEEKIKAEADGLSSDDSAYLFADISGYPEGNPKELSRKGHRKRAKEIVREGGVEKLYEHTMLEFILFYCIQYKDTKPIAYELLNRFGNIYGVFNAPPELIEQVKNVTHDAATFLNALSGICERYADESGKREKMSSVDGILDYMRRIVSPNVEACYAISLNNDDEIISVEKVLEGTDNALEIPLRLLVKTILNANARRVVVLHNHPSGKVTASEHDKSYTYIIQSLLEELKVELVDHFVVYEKYAFSMKNGKMYKHNWRMR